MMRLSGFSVLNRYCSDDDFKKLEEVFDKYPKAEIEVFVHAPAEAGLSLIPKVKYTLKDKRGNIIYYFDFAERVYKWKKEEIYITRHEEVALYAHMHCGDDIYWSISVRTLRQRLGNDFMADEKELELDCTICY